MTEAQAAYLAGVIDGEGYIGINRKGAIKVTVSNSSQVLMAWLLQFGGLVSEQRRPSCTQYYWNLRAREQLEILPKIIPYMVIKRNLAETALAVRQQRQVVDGRY